MYFCCMHASACLLKIPEILSVQLLDAFLEVFGLLDEPFGCMQTRLDVLDLNTQVLNLHHRRRSQLIEFS